MTADLASTLDTVRRALLLILVVGLAGTVVELFFLKHTGEWREWMPIVLIGLSLAVLLWYAIARSVAAIRVHQALMFLFLVVGGVGTVLHMQGNIQDEVESDPSLSGRALYGRALMGTTPTLAPGTMVQLGLVGLLFTFRHPSLSRRRDGIAS